MMSYLVSYAGFLMQIDPDDLPKYSKGGHMIGIDVIIYEQTQAEMVRKAPCFAIYNSSLKLRPYQPCLYKLP